MSKENAEVAYDYCIGVLLLAIQQLTRKTRTVKGRFGKKEYPHHICNRLRQRSHVDSYIFILLKISEFYMYMLIVDVLFSTCKRSINFNMLRVAKEYVHNC